MQPPANILIVEDEPAIADTLVYALRTEGFEPVWRATGSEALDELGSRMFALVILDVGLPDANGFELCKIIRLRSPRMPVLFLTARSSEVDRIVGLEIGGDDYVTKPFSPREVSARVKAILRRANMAPPAPVSSTPSSSAAPFQQAERRETGFAHDSERCEIRYNGARLDLTRYEYRLLKTLLSRPGRVFSRDELMTRAWEDPGASLDRTVDAHIKTLRAKLRAAAPEIDPIQTHRGMGYSLRV
ncbi:two-component system response regulator CreB [Ereboglobus luteus]|uniref:Two-component system response regulator CreB n=1 Tax=Ereboglobus luteus TaxID=1796921 RepID=A0A2U8E5R4_9BACT|nr:two-component system response regulator CreB [Ereboglobus luteus]AWI10197.1 two-component system response regulator CreB [Ereboglobus luteus]